MAERIFHLLLPGAWLGAASWEPPSLTQEGLVHLSFARQIPGTTEVHFPLARELWLLEIDHAAVEDDLRIEASRGDEHFPHLYRALDRDEVLGWWKLERDGNGPWRLPLIAPEAEADEPQREDGAP